MFTLGQVANFLERASARVRPAMVSPTEALMLAAVAEAHEMIGTPGHGWAPLKEQTIARKRNGNTPLLESGAMRESIHGEAEATGYGVEGVVGSSDIVAVYQELGTSRIPPRPFLSQALAHIEHEAGRVFGELAVRSLTPGI